MSVIHGFEIPDDLYYWVDRHIWIRPEPEGLYRVGMTTVAYHLLQHSLEAITVKRSVIGKEVPRGRSVAMVESVKFIGGVPAPFAGTVMAANELLAGAPERAEEDPYGAGWIIEMRASDPASALTGLVTGEAGQEAYRKLLEVQKLV